IEYYESVGAGLAPAHDSSIINGQPQGLPLQSIPDSSNTITYLVDRFIRLFDLSCAPLFRVGLIRVQENEHVLLFDMHHIVSDGVSMDILVREFAGLYTGQKLPPLRIRYNDFAAWESRLFDSHFMKEQETFWLEHLKGELPKLQMPLDFRRPEKQGFSGSEMAFSIPAEVTKKMNVFAKEKNITLNILVLSIYFLLVAKYSDQEDIIAGSLVSGRSHVDLGEIIGMFGNFLPIRNRVEPDKRFLDFLDASKQVIITVYENQDYPFEKMIDKLNYEIDFSRNPVFDIMLILHNEMDPSLRLEMDDLTFSSYPLENRIAQLDFKLDIYLGAEGDLPCLLEFNTGLFKEETIRGFIDHFLILIDRVIEKPDIKIADIALFDEEEKVKLSEKRKRNAPEAKKKVGLTVSATFTSEPIENHILWWGEQFGLHMDIEFAPYNQVFPQLLDEESLLSTNKGINLLLIRFEDWVRDLQLPDEEICDKLEDDFNRLVKIIKEKPKPAPYFVGLFPTATHMSFSPQVRYYLRGITRRWRKIIEEIDNVYPVDFTPLNELYAITEIFDPVADREGHVPFSSEFYAAIGSTIVRQIYAMDYNPFKLVVLDCDNTLWQGICGEDGPEGVSVAPPYLELQQRMIRLHDKGFLLTLCSKNNEADVWEVFEKNPGMVLKKEHLTGWIINWQPKSENIKELAEELNLGMDSFIFIDDSPVECAEVRSNCPEVLTLQLPENPENIPLFLKHVWAFDKIKVTDEDRTRTTMYRAEIKRKDAEKGSPALTDFLAGLELKISLNIMAAHQVPRVSQLTQRTNQFNLSAIRRREDEILKLVKEPGNRCWVIEVSDRFGDYGLVGVVITKEKQDSLFIDTFLLSCRVLGRGVEETILAGLRKYCEPLHLEKLEARYYPTPKNMPFIKFLQEKWQLQERPDETYTTFVYPFAETSEAVEFVDFYYMKEFEKRLSPENPGTEKTVPANAVTLPGSNEKKVVQSLLSQVHWEIDAADSGDAAGMLHANYLLPLRYFTAGLLLGLPTYKFNEKIGTRAKYEAPRNETEKKLSGIWGGILGLEKIGVHDSFFESGGDSLKAVTQISEIHKAFDVELTLRDIFEKKTIRQISGLMAGAQRNIYSVLET
ncbi:MAG: HAD-IIIC family phosphatase, partial [Candidatus Aminicenantes bacterium]|nr:HAD-IIIC family phosphatase [Candidatus Aminicenantes bacterium]